MERVAEMLPLSRNSPTWLRWIHKACCDNFVSWTFTLSLAHRDLGKQFRLAEVTEWELQQLFPKHLQSHKGRANATGIRQSHLRKKWIESHTEAKYFSNVWWCATREGVPLNYILPKRGTYGFHIPYQTECNISVIRNSMQIGNQMLFSLCNDVWRDGPSYTSNINNILGNVDAPSNVLMRCTYQSSLSANLTLCGVQSTPKCIRNSHSSYHQSYSYARINCEARG